MSPQPDMMALHRQILEGAALQKTGDWVAADRIYQGVIAQVPGHPLALHLAASRGQFLQAGAMQCQRASARSDGDIEMAFEYMHDCQQQGMPPKAFAVAELPGYGCKDSI